MGSSLGFTEQGVTRTAVEELPPKARPTPTLVSPPTPEPIQAPLPAPAPQPTVIDPDVMQVVLTAFSGLGYALSARALLLLALIGAFALATMAMLTPSTMRLLVLIAFATLVVLPCVWLEIRKRE